MLVLQKIGFIEDSKIIFFYAQLHLTYNAIL